MSASTERSAIYQWFSNSWDPNVDGPIAWPNQRFEQPQGELFVVFTLLTFTSNQMSLGANINLYRHFGEVQIDIYVPQNKGVATARTAADKIAGIFRNKSFSTSDGNLITFRTPTFRELAVNETRALNMDDIKYRLIVLCPFQRDEYL
jgi:hypothetical protein